MSDYKCSECGKCFLWGEDSDSQLVADRGSQWESCRTNAHWKHQFHMESLHPEVSFVCPRAAESGVELIREHFWRDTDGYQTCGYCGSISPDEFFKAIENGCELGPTDKSYKVYVTVTHPDAGEPCVLASANHKPDGDGWIELTPETRLTLPLDSQQLANFKDGSFVQVSKRSSTKQVKFYFQHLSNDQQLRFIDLINAKKVNIGFPGYFYRLPFFCTPVHGDKT